MQINKLYPQGDKTVIIIADTGQNLYNDQPTQRSEGNKTKIDH